MRRMIISLIIVGVFLGTAGCTTTGYTVRIETDTLEYSASSRIVAMLTSKGYSVGYRERVRYKGADLNDVSTFLEKRFSRERVIHGVNPNNMKAYFEKRYNDERYWWVGITLLYVRDTSHNVVRHVSVDIYNYFIGGISPEMRTEIDQIGDLLYEDLTSTVGRDNVRIERKEWGPPVIY